MSRSIPFCFAIPLRSKAASKNWSRVEAQLSDTLRAVLAQTDPDFMVFVACHDVPDIPELDDSRITVLRTNTPTPNDADQMMLDKKHKRKMMAVEFGKRGGGYFMLTDADDLVSNRIVEFVRSTNDPNGYIVMAGWIYDASNGTVIAHSALHKYCGTCAIFRFERHDLPTGMDDDAHRRHDDFQKHVDFRRVAAQLNRPLRPIPFASAVYVLGHGENWSMVDLELPLHRRIASALKNVPRRMLGKRRPTPAMRREFGLR